VAAALAADGERKKENAALGLEHQPGYNEAQSARRDATRLRNGKCKSLELMLLEEHTISTFCKGTAAPGSVAKRRIGLLTNQTGVDFAGAVARLTVLAQASGSLRWTCSSVPSTVQTGTLDTIKPEANSKDEATGVPYL